MIISCCIIIKDDNELNNLKRCVASLIDYVDEIIITANGQEVKDIEIYCQRNNLKYFYHVWAKDFSDQRNFCASKIRKDADFYIWADADDVLIGGQYLQDVALLAKKNNMDTVFFTYWYSCSYNGEPSAKNVKSVELTQMRERLIRPGSITWHKRIHETPIPVENLNFKYTQVRYSEDYPIVWLHLGVSRELSIEKQETKTKRNQELLELELADERKEGTADPRTLLYLMKIYTESEDEKLLNGSLEMGKEYLNKSGWDAERAMCCALMGRCFEKLKKVDEAKNFLFRSIQEYPYDPILYLYLSRVCLNLKQYQECKHWLTIALSLDTSTPSANMSNIFEMKLLSTEILLHYYFNGERNIKKAYQSAQLLVQELPNEDNLATLKYLKELNDLDEACASAHKLAFYYQDLNESKKIVDLIESMPATMQNLPFAWKMYNKHKEPRIWRENEICYYATFGQEHFEKWGPENLKTGLGGSETAVIRLAQEWVKKGYVVVVYCDCGQQEGMHDGVFYIPYFKFNPKDSFNIFIQWRSSSLAGKIKAKKFIIDLHDLYNEDILKKIDSYDKVFVKSQYQRSLAKDIADNKFKIVSNGI